MNTEQERAEFEAWAKTHYYLSELGLDFENDEYVDMEVQGAFEAYQAGRAALQSQSVIDDEHLSIVLDVYDNAMQKAFDGREFQNPCKPGTPEHKAWEKGSKEGKKKRDAGLPHSIALQSQDREDAARIEFLEKEWFYRNTEGVWSFCFNELWEAGQHDSLREAIDHARRVEGGG